MESEVAVENVRVFVAPDSFDLVRLFEEAALLDSDEYQEGSSGIKRPSATEDDCDESVFELQDVAQGPQAGAQGNRSLQQTHNAPSGQARPGDNAAKGTTRKPQTRKNQRRKKARNHSRAESTQPRSAPPEVGARYLGGATMQETNVRYVDLPASSCGYHGKKDGEETRRLAAVEDCSVQTLLAQGCTEIQWDGVTPEVVVENGTGKVLVILAGRPSCPSYLESADRVADAISNAREAAGFTQDERSHYRAENSAALNVGIYHGGGTEKPCNLDNGRHTKMVEELVRNPDVSRMAAFADAAFKLWSPDVYDEVHSALTQICNRDAKLKKNWDSNAYPCAAFNFGPEVRCKPHKDSGNSPKTLCAIQAVGCYDAAKGGHLYIRELQLLIQFPAGSTILIPSALLTHANTPVAKGEVRLSFTQFVPGGLFRYVDNGFKTEKQLKRKSRREYREKVAEKAGRWRRDMGVIPTLKELRERYNVGGATLVDGQAAQRRSL